MTRARFCGGPPTGLTRSRFFRKMLSDTLFLNVFLLFTASIMWSFCTPASVEAQKAGATVDRDVLAVIEKEYPRAIVPKYLDTASCGPQKYHPGWVKADFNGDGRLDHAVLLVIENKEGIGMGKRYDLDLVVLWQDKPGVYRTELVEKLVENSGAVPSTTIKELMTTSIYIQKQPEGVVQESAAVGDRKVNLISPGILLVSCEQWARVYYWDRTANRFAEIQTAD